MHATVLPDGVLDSLFRAIDSMDAESFGAFITEKGEFRFGSAPVVKGREAIVTAVEHFFGTIDALSHSVSRVWRDDQSLACEGEVCYRRKDGGEIIIPFVDVFDFEGELISSYRIYIDIGPLYAE